MDSIYVLGESVPYSKGAKGLSDILGNVYQEKHVVGVIQGNGALR